MSIPGLLFALALSLIALAIVARPLLVSAASERLPGSGRQDQRERLERYYERALTNIRDLDEDFATGKINEVDYRREREVWAQRGIRTLRVMDQLESDSGSPADFEDERIEQAIEEAVAAYRAARQAGAGDAT